MYKRKTRALFGVLLLVTAIISLSFVSNTKVKVAVLKYSGGGDWYANPSSLPNLVKYFNLTTNAKLDETTAVVSADQEELYSYPFLHMTGHGNVIFSDSEVRNLRKYLLGGGFLHIDDNYGMDQYVRREIKKIFPNKQLVELPFDHAIYKKPNLFKKGLPKVHEHDKKPPQGFAIFDKGRVVLFYTYECDLGDGWEDPEVHNDSKALREKALNMGVNILSYAFTLE